MKIKFADIIIPEYMMRSRPSTAKVYKHLHRFLDGADIAKEIVVNQHGVLIDGFARYCALLIDGYQYIPELEIHVTEKEQKHHYLYGKHRENGEEYCWRIVPNTKSKGKLRVGGYAVVKTCHGNLPVKITSIITQDGWLVSDRVIKTVVRAVDSDEVSYGEKGYTLNAT